MSNGTVYIYSGLGVGERAQHVLPRVLSEALKSHEVKVISASEILAEKLSYPNSAALVIPGGADVPYCDALNGEGCRSIREFVGDGGIYIGFCAGAYFASERICWNSGQADEILAARELSFFPGIAVGPFTGPGTYNAYSESGARICEVLLPDGNKAWSYANGGCYFESDSKQHQTIARYAELKGEPAAIVAMNFGLGKVVLSGIHPEYPADCLENDHPLKPRLTEVDSSRALLLKMILSPLLN